MNPGMKKSIDHRRLSDAHGMWAIGNFRGMKYLTLDEKEKSALDYKRYLGAVLRQEIDNL